MNIFLARMLALSKKVSVLVPSGGTVCIDHWLFLTVAENLIGNAALFAEKAISIQITRQNDSLVLKVEDDGAGYPLSLVQNGPNPFETTSSNSSHFGMGLDVYKRQKNGSSISVRQVWRAARQ